MGGHSPQSTDRWAGKHPGKDQPPGALLGVQDTGEGPGEFLPRPRAYKGVKKERATFVQKTGRKSAPMSNETNVWGFQGLKKYFSL